jgi:Uma2 family endonuclease
MSSTPEPRRYTYAEYLALEAETGIRHEFLDGQVWAMSGGSPRHSAVKVNLVAALKSALRGTPCRPYDSDLKLRVPESGLATYADAAVTCGPLVPDAGDPMAATNPTLIAEVLSPSTEAWDRDWKWDHYRSMRSLRHFLLVDPGTPKVEHYERLPDDTWHFTVHRTGDVVRVAALGIDLPVDALYEDLPD